MKDPTGKHYEVDVDFSNAAVCEGCWEPWPCTTIQTWRKSKEFRIRELNTLTDLLAKNTAQLENRVAALDESMRRSVALIHALLSAHGDNHGENPININTSVDYIDITTSLDYSVVRASGLKSTVVTYKDMEWQA